MARKRLKDGMHWTCQYVAQIDSYIVRVDVTEKELRVFSACRDVNNYHIKIKTFYSMLEAIWFLSLMVNNFIEDRRIA